MKYQFDVLVVGAGPAGLSAAHSAAAAGMQVGLIDDNPMAGGQIWRGGPEHSKDYRAMQLWEALRVASNVHFLAQTRILYPCAAGQLLVQTPDAAFTVEYERLVLATGARERLLPFPGWTLPGVTGAGGLQALVKGGFPIAGKRVVVAGSGPLLLAVAATLKERDANVIAIVEQTLLHQLTRFALSLLATPGKLRQALQLGSQLKHTPYYMNSYVLEAQGKTGLEKVVLQRGAQPQPELIDCDYLACGFGLIPNIELAIALGCASAEGVVQVDRWQQTSVHGVFCAGESTGIGGVDLSLVEGRIAGLAAVNDLSQASIDIIERERWQRFARRLTNTFVLRPELRDVCDDSTIVCRCEDVCHGELAQHTSWRSAKLHTRCGMGPCQGRVCSGATDFLYGWSQDSVRMPLSPARIDSILSVECANDAL